MQSNFTYSKLITNKARYAGPCEVVDKFSLTHSSDKRYSEQSQIPQNMFQGGCSIIGLLTERIKNVVFRKLEKYEKGMLFLLLMVVKCVMKHRFLSSEKYLGLISEFESFNLLSRGSCLNIYK